jgi:hypothetical protein
MPKSRGIERCTKDVLDDVVAVLDTATHITTERRVFRRAVLFECAPCLLCGAIPPAAIGNQQLRFDKGQLELLHTCLDWLNCIWISKLEWKIPSSSMSLSFFSFWMRLLLGSILRIESAVNLTILSYHRSIDAQCNKILVRITITKQKAHRSACPLPLLLLSFGIDLYNIVGFGDKSLRCVWQHYVLWSYILEILMRNSNNRTIASACEVWQFASGIGRRRADRYLPVIHLVNLALQFLGCERPHEQQHCSRIWRWMYNIDCCQILAHSE